MLFYANHLRLGNEGATIDRVWNNIEEEMKLDRSDDSFTALGKAHYFEPSHLRELEAFKKYFAHLRSQFLSGGEFIEETCHEYEVQLEALHNFFFKLSIMCEKAIKPTWCALAMRGGIADDPGAVEERLADYYADKAMLDLDSDLSPEALLPKKIEIETKINQLRNEVFSGLVVAGLWNEDMKQKYANLVLSSNVDMPTKLLILSAVTISCIHTFDFQKFAFLVDMYLHAGDSSVFKSRAIVGIMFGTSNMPKLYLNKARQLLKAAMQEDDKLMSLLVKAAKVQFHTLNVDEGEDIFHHQLSKMLIKRMKDYLSDEEEEEAYDSYDEEDEEEDDKEIHEMMELMNQGTDIYYSQFKKMKNKAFFHSMYNWFMPFYSDCEVYLKLQQKFGTQYEAVQQFFFEKSTLCDSDRYSFAYIMLDAKDDFAKMMNQMQEEMGDEIGGDDSESRDPVLEQVSDLRAIIYYIQNLARFFDLAPMKGDFANPMDETDVQKYDVPLALSLFDDPCFDKERIKLARYFFRHDGYSLVPQVMPENMPDTAECHYMMGYSIFKYDEMNPKNVMDALPHVEWLLKHSGDTKLFLQLAAHVYDSANLYDKAEACWKRMLAIPDDENAHISAKRELALLYSLTKRYKEAVGILYEFYYQNPNSIEYFVLLLRNLLLANPGDMATVDKVLDMLNHFNEENETTSLKDALNFPVGDSPEENLKNMFTNFITTVSEYMQEDHALDYALKYYTGLCRWVKEGFSKDLIPLMADYYVNGATEEYDHDHVYEYQMIGNDISAWLKSFGKTDADIAIAEEVMRARHNDFLESTKHVFDDIKKDMRKNNDNGKLE